MNLELLRAMLWLRWRLTRNQWRRSGQVNAVITSIAAILALCAGVSGAIGGTIAGFKLSQSSPMSLLIGWDVLVVGFLFVWVTGVVAELQRSEAIDLNRLLHLPVSLSQVFFLNYCASHLSFSLAVAIPTSLGLWLGSLFGAGTIMLLLPPLIAGFFFMITAWTYCLRGWLASLMTNPRRRRTVIVTITMIFVIGAQLPNLVMNFWFRRPGQNRETATSPAQVQARRAADQESRGAMVDLAHRSIPFLWLPYSAKSLKEGRPGPVLLATAGSIAIGMLGMWYAYRSTERFYRRVGGTKVARVSSGTKDKEKRPSRRDLLVNWRIPFFPDTVVALALASLRSMLRAPEVKMALAMNIVVFGIIGVGVLMRGEGGPPAMVLLFLPAAVVGVTLLGLVQVQSNLFGFDREGFRAFVLTPVPRRHIVFGKSLALFPIGATMFLINLGLVQLLTGFRPVAVLESCLLFLSGYLLLSIVGNLSSILAPYRISPGTMKPTRMTATTTFLMLVMTLVLPLAMSPLAVPTAAGLLAERFASIPGNPVRWMLTAGLTALSILAYGLALRPLGRLLHSREQTILQIVTQEVE